MAVTSVPELVRRAAAWYGDDEAVTDGDRRLSFKDVDKRSDRLAHVLRSLNENDLSRVAVLLQNRAECVEIDFAVSKAGKIRVPINPRLAGDERKYVLNDSGTDVVVTDRPGAEFLRDERADLPELRHLIVLGGGDRSGLDYETALAGASSAVPASAPDLDAGSYILYTSGTTGRPKGAVTTNRGRLSATNAMLVEELEVPRGGAMAHVGSMAHGSGSKVLAYFYRGARNIPVAKWDPEQFLVLAADERVSGTFLVPTMINDLVDAAGRLNSAVSSLRTISYGGAPISDARLDQALETLGPVLVQVYGSCEAPHPVLILNRDDHRRRLHGDRQRLGAVGRPTLAWDVEVRDSSGKPLPAGETGELTVRGTGLMSGYWQNPVASAEVLSDGWYSTGDVARFDSDGYFYLVDRARDVIISGGLNVYPAEVERVIKKHPGVAEAVVFGVPDEAWGETVIAAVVRQGGSRVTGDLILAHCREHVASYKKPTRIMFVDDLPKGSTGKILKREVRQAYLRGTDRHG